MKTSNRIAALACVPLALGMAMAQAQGSRHYGPEDEGRRFSDGSRVVCEKVEVQRSSRDPNRVAGTAAGAVIGGLVGNQIGDGKGRKLATVGGAVAGGAIGRKVQGDRQEARGDRVIETRCERVWR
ncbi:glycine zipper 2TM domain-containing protein [Pseudoxanthomonas sp.]|uniref:glycine zipper 2TM domain-containing protein n=1 Tax=Pseudoxanthomonas sp. TaxID=1871049 RepID=UPI00258C9EE5|nr:glycine zipper 2TM domain-containing protein [Pseudoxanthomonas sp.]MCR6686720.1 glycine zipper 2TM domain-containing protein [Pseudoxanthomonas sp.]